MEEEFKKYLKKLDESKPIIVCGDLNVAHKEIDLKNPKTNRKNAGFTDEEREKMTKLIETGFTDTFRYLYPDKENSYTWWSYMGHAREKNVGWRIDYFLTSNRIKFQTTPSNEWVETAQYFNAVPATIIIVAINPVNRTPILSRMTPPIINISKKTLNQP